MILILSKPRRSPIMEVGLVGPVSRQEGIVVLPRSQSEGPWSTLLTEI